MLLIPSANRDNCNLISKKTTTLWKLSKPVKDLRELIDRLDDDFAIEFRVRRKLTEDELSEHANRHAICHGRQCNYGTKEHALKTNMHGKIINNKIHIFDFFINPLILV